MGKKVLGIIPARGGSKRIPRKNLAQVRGRSLLQWSFDEAKKSRYLDRLILSSEDDEIIAEARRIGLDVPFKRPSHLSEDSTPGISPVLHALEQLPDYQIVVLLQATSPLRSVDDIDQALEALVRNDTVSIVSVTPVGAKLSWMFTLPKLESGSMRPIAPASDETVYALNGAIYAADVAWLVSHKNFLSEQTHAYVMPEERALDIDLPSDLAYFRFRAASELHYQDE